MDGFAHIGVEATKIFRVAIENITPLWGQLEPLVARALRGRPTHDNEDVRKLLMAQVSHLWVQMTGSELEAFVISDFEVMPKGIWVRAWLAASQPNQSFDFEGFRSALTNWAISNNCRGIVGGGRIGWLGRYPDAKFDGVSARVTFDA